jgi:hypothetical protein
MGCVRVAAAMCVCIFTLGFGGSLAVASGRCPNEALRVGPSARLPDCRAYELVGNLGGSADMIFVPNLDHAVVASDGEHLALAAETVFVEPGAHILGTDAVYSRTNTGWTAQSIADAGMAAESFEPALFSPDLAQVAFTATPRLSDQVDPTGTESTLYAGPIGGPFAALEPNIPNHGEGTEFVGANAGTPSVAALSDIVFQSLDRELLPQGREHEIAEATRAQEQNLYEWSYGGLQLVNVEGEGAQLRLLNPCGAQLGEGTNSGNAFNAVSPDGSRVFFISPVPGAPAPCQAPQLYMRVDDRETVDISEPEGVSIEPSARGRIRYDGASADGSKVFFTAGTALTANAEQEVGPYFYEYDTDAPMGQRLTLVANQVNGVQGEYNNPSVVVSEDGSTVYYAGTSTIRAQGHSISTHGIWRYETSTGKKSFVAVPSETLSAGEPSYSTPNGGFLVFAAGIRGIQVEGPRGLEIEPRGVGSNELYRYDAAEGSVVCVSCGAGVAPILGKVRVSELTSGLLTTPDSLSTAISISEDGQRVFFETTAKLVPGDTNESTAHEEVNSGLGRGLDVYEWEAEGAEEGPGLFCGAANGCTHLISAGEDVGPENFLGASADGNNIFFTSAAQLVPQATPEFTNIYDARVDGGFPPPPPSAECTSCQGVGSPPPQFGAGASLAFAGTGNHGTHVVRQAKKPKPRCKRGYRRNKKGRCERVAPTRSGKGR